MRVMSSPYVVMGVPRRSSLRRAVCVRDVHSLCCRRALAEGGHPVAQRRVEEVCVHAEGDDRPLEGRAHRAARALCKVRPVAGVCRGQQPCALVVRRGAGSSYPLEADSDGQPRALAGERVLAHSVDVLGRVHLQRVHGVLELCTHNAQAAAAVAAVPVLADSEGPTTSSSSAHGGGGSRGTVESLFELVGVGARLAGVGVERETLDPAQCLEGGGVYAAEVQQLQANKPAPQRPRHPAPVAGCRAAGKLLGGHGQHVDLGPDVPRHRSYHAPGKLAPAVGGCVVYARVHDGLLVLELRLVCACGCCHHVLEHVVDHLAKSGHEKRFSLFFFFFCFFFRSIKVVCLLLLSYCVYDWLGFMFN